MSPQTTYRLNRTAYQILAALLLLIAGLGASRLLYEGLFPRFLMLSRPAPAISVATMVAAAAWSGWYLLVRQRALPSLALLAALLPLLLNLLYLLDPAVDLAGSRFLFAASVWLTAVFVARELARVEDWSWLGIFFLLLALLPAYLLTMPDVAGRADTFEFQVVIPQLGIAHPTGYPLYILLGRLFAALPVGSVAWRINLASAVFAVLAASMLYLSGRRLWREPVAALLAALLFGLTPTFWSQAVEAEVYALHALFVATALWLTAVMLDLGRDEAVCKQAARGWLAGNWQRSIWLLALVLGLGLTNHLTTIVLLPAAVLVVWLAYGQCLRAQTWRENLWLLFKVTVALLLPLLLYAYLPWRWQAIHEEPMGWQRFVDWVAGGRFQGALQLAGWLTDRTRYEVVWRLLLAEWGWFNLLLALWGVVYATGRNWRVTLVLLVTGAGYVFYTLNYYVPDLAVFLIPAHLVIALLWGAGLAGMLAASVVLLVRLGHAELGRPVETLLILLATLPALASMVRHWPDAGFADQVPLQTWGEGVLAMPLEPGAAVLADSEKIAPLYYLQQAEGWRPDLDIKVLPDEAAYRAELDARLGAGDTVYLARFLPGLQGAYHLRSLGPLVEVSTQPLTALPDTVVPSGLEFDGVRLLGYTVEEPATVDQDATAVTFFWQADQPGAGSRYVYTRWSGAGYEGQPAIPAGTHPVSNYYPTAAWRLGEIVPDYHLLPRPLTGAVSQLDLQVAFGPQFADPANLDWQTVTRVEVQPAKFWTGGKAFRAQNGRMLLSHAGFAEEVRPGAPLPVVVAGYAPLAGLLDLALVPLHEEGGQAPRAETLIRPGLEAEPLIYEIEVPTDLPNGRYHLLSTDPSAAAVCGWLAPPTTGCVLGEVTINGVPLAQNAANFDDKLALLDIDLPDNTLQPGNTLPVRLRWQSLAPMSEDYTVFLQVLDEHDQIVGQVDAWPLQGTYPTSRWQAGETVDDPYEIQLPGDLPAGAYRLQVGLYLLATMRRLPLLDAGGRPIDDKVVISDLMVE